MRRSRSSGHCLAITPIRGLLQGTCLKAMSTFCLKMVTSHWTVDRLKVFVAFTCIQVLESDSPSLAGDNKQLKLLLPSRKVEVFDEVPENLLEDKYYVPLSTDFSAIDALIKEAALQYTVTDNHPVKAAQVVAKLAALSPSKTMFLVFIVPESIAASFSKQRILTVNGTTPVKMPAIQQFVVGLPLGIDTSSNKKRRIE
jgi:hypothetical protein